MRITYVGSPPLFTRGASAIHIFKMCNAYGNNGHEVTLLIPPYDKEKDIFGYYNVTKNFRIKCIISPRHILRQIIHGISCSIYVGLNKHKADLYITRNIVFAFISTMLLRVPTIYDAHHPAVNQLAVVMLKLFLGSEYLIRLSTNSAGLAELYKTYGIREDKIVVAHNGVDLDNLKYLPKSEARKKTNLPQDKKLVFYSGNIYKGRGVETLIEAAGLIPDVLFYIVGGEQRDIDRYKNILDRRKMENFRFVGFVNQEDVFSYLLSADVLVMPYTMNMTIRSGTVASEFTSPIKLFEYMASGRVIVASSIPVLMEILNENNSMLVKPDNAASLAEGIKYVLDNRDISNKLSKKALEDVKAYTWNERAKKILLNL